MDQLRFKFGSTVKFEVPPPLLKTLQNNCSLLLSGVHLTQSLMQLLQIKFKYYLLLRHPGLVDVNY